MPALVGVPATAPPLVTLSPLGTVPALTRNVYGAAPPDPYRIWVEYAEPTAPPRRVLGLMEIVGAMTVKL